MRKAYLDILLELAKKDSNVVSLVADNGLIVYDDFKHNFPDRFFNFGIAEENMVAAAAGMASVGKIPFVYTISSFLAYRSYEFLRDDVCYQNQNVKIVGIGSGITYSTLGPSHHTTEDIGLLRSLPNLTIFSPSTRSEMKWIMKQAYQINGPVYIRLCNNDKDYYGYSATFKLGIPSIVKDGKDVAIITTGSIINEVMDASNMLNAIGISARIISVHTLKPILSVEIKKLLSGIKKIVIVEEHNVMAGLFSAIAEVLVKEEIFLPVLSIGLEDSFAIDYGTLQNVRMANGLDARHIKDKIAYWLLK